ncbi:MAG: methyl-accepting chemotaxis protein, partial [Pseudobdellovibrio sp.]
NKINQLQDIIKTLLQVTNQVSNASFQGAAAATELSEASTEQAANLQQTMSTIAQISAIINQNADSAGKTKAAVDQNQSNTEHGLKSVEAMENAIADIKVTNHKILSQMETGNREISEIVQIISEIGQKTNVINDIVFQTKLLSFNASVEAARAGEQGKGFAVVAEEVGNLAQMSGSAAKEISDMLSQSIKKVNTIVKRTSDQVNQLIEVGKDKISMGEATVQNCKMALGEINQNARHVAHMIAEITRASKEQATGVQEITKSFSHIEQVTQQNASVAQQSAEQAEQLSTESHHLSQAVTQLSFFVDGQTRPAHTTNPVGRKSAKSEIKKAAAVIPFQKKSHVKAPAKNNNFPAAQATSLKSVSGAGTVPLSSDPGFEEF